MPDQISSDPLIGEGMFAFPNIARVATDGQAAKLSRKRVCPHCQNHCEVMLIRPREAMAPCPMCMGGAIRNRHAEKRGEPHWSSRDQAARCAWEGGYTLEHRYPCVALSCKNLSTEPAGFCQQHDPNRRFKPPAYPFPHRSVGAESDNDKETTDGTQEPT